MTDQEDISTWPTMGPRQRSLAPGRRFVARFAARRALVVIALLVEACSAWLVLHPSSTLVTTLGGLALHVAASALVTGGLWGPSSARAQAILCGVVALLAFPLVGMIGMVTGLAVTASRAARPRELAAFPGPEAPSDAARLLTERRPIDVDGELAIEPIVDLLREDDIDVKREAIDALVRVDRRLAVGVLQNLIRDPHGDVRLYASIALSRIEDDVAREMLLARQAVSHEPSNPDAHVRLASLYVDYGLSGLVHSGAQRRFLSLARDEYGVARQLTPEDGGAASALGRVHLLCGHREAAQVEFANALSCDPRCLEARLGLMELAFENGDVGDLVGYASAARPLIGRDHPQRALVDWWASRPEVPSGRS